MPEIPERVALGAAFMDEHDPDWWRADTERAIDLGVLDLAEPSVCVLGQRCPVETLAQYQEECDLDASGTEGDRYWAYGAALSGMSTGRLTRWSNDLGFSVLSSSLDLYEALTTEWRRVITERRAAQ